MILNNFVRGKLDEDLNGRFDLPIFSNGFPYIKNYICNYKGNLKYRTGFEYVDQTKDNRQAKIFQFRFNTEQAYLVVATEKNMRFYTYDADGNFGFVTNDSNQILELNTGIPFAHINNMQKTQNADVMYITEKNFNPKKLKRTSATSFTIENAIPSGINFNNDGFPSSVSFYKGRLWYGGFSKKPTTLKGSKVTSYDNFTIPSSDIKDDDALSLTLSDISDPISWVIGGKRNLIVGNPEGISIVNGGTVDEPITSTAVNADLANRESASGCYPAEKDTQMLYVANDKTKVFAFDYDLISESFVSSNLNLLSEDVGKVVELHYKRDKNNLVYGRLDNGQLIALLYNKSENINGWFPIETNGFVHSMCSVVRPDGKDDLFICVERNGNFYIERMTDEVDFTNFYETDYLNDEDKEKYNRLQLEELKKCIYVDNAVRLTQLFNVPITLNGDTLTASSSVFSVDFVGHNIQYKTKDGSQYGEMRVEEFVSETELKVKVLTKVVTPLTYDYWYLTFNTIVDLEDVEGLTQSVVADGGYIGEYKVENGTIVLDKDYTTVIVGFGYTGLAKTFNLGFYANGRNTQTMKKRINEFVLRFVNSAGFKIGTSLDNLQNVQLFNPNGFYDSTPLLMSSDEKIVGYNDSHDTMKSIYLVQDIPLPCNLTMVEYKISFEALE